MTNYHLGTIKRTEVYGATQIFSQFGGVAKVAMRKNGCKVIARFSQDLTFADRMSIQRALSADGIYPL